MKSNDSQHQENCSGKQKTAFQGTLLSYLRELVFGIVGILLIYMFFFRVVIVSGPSMNNTLKDGDCLLLVSNLISPRPKYGDIIVASKETFKNGEPIIKRVIATEGQLVDIDFVEGTVYVDGIALDEPYINTATNMFEGTKFPLVVEENCVFVMGDNRNDSKDSRSPEIGLIDCRQIVGKALFLALPAEDAAGRRDFGRIGVLW